MCMPRRKDWCKTMKTFLVFVCGVALGMYLEPLLANMYAHAMMGQQVPERSM